MFLINSYRYGAGGAPTAATWNPADRGAGIGLDATNLIATGGSSTQLVRATRALSTANKQYWEVTIFSNSTNGANVVNGAGVVVGSVSVSTQIGGPGDNLGMYTNTQDVYFNNAVVVNPANVASNTHVFMFAYDPATRKLWTGRSGTGWYNSGDPAAGTGQVYTLPAGTFYPGASPNGGTDASRHCTANFGASAFSGSVPSGFSAFNSVA